MCCFHVYIGKVGALVLIDEVSKRNKKTDSNKELEAS